MSRSGDGQSGSGVIVVVVVAAAAVALALLVTGAAVLAVAVGTTAVKIISIYGCRGYKPSNGKFLLCAPKDIQRNVQRCLKVHSLLLLLFFVFCF